jgi:hypothetical protein
MPAPLTTYPIDSGNLPLELRNLLQAALSPTTRAFLEPVVNQLDANLNWSLQADEPFAGPEVIQLSLFT